MSFYFIHDSLGMDLHFLHLEIKCKNIRKLHQLNEFFCKKI